MRIATHRFPTRWLAIVASLVIALALSACINSQTAAPDPAAAPDSEGTATPAPTPEEARPPEPGPSEQDTAPRLQETYNALSGPEQECIQDQLGEETLEIFLRTPVGGLYDHPEHWQPAAIFGCLKRETANDVFMAIYEADSRASEAVLACLRNLLEEIDIAKAAWGFHENAQEPTDEQISLTWRLLMGEVACLEDHGPSADSPEPPGPPPPEHALLWEFKMPDTGDFPMIAATITGGTLFIASRPGQVYALEAETGKVRWHTELDAYLSPPPVVRDSKVYVDSINVHYTLDANTGEVLETNEGQGPRHTDPPDPEIGRIYRLEGGLPPGTRVHAVDAATGTRVWTYDVGSIVPVAPTQSGGTVFVRSYEGVHALDESTGKLLWETAWEYVGDYPPHIVDGIWPVAGDGTVTALDARTGKRLWSFEEDHIDLIAGAADGMVLAAGNLGFYGIEAATGHKKWSLNKDWRVFYVTVADGVIYANVVTGDLHTLDLQTGEPLWTQRIGYYLGPEYGLYRVVDGVVYVTHREGVRAYRAPAATDTRPPAETRAPAPTPTPTPEPAPGNSGRLEMDDNSRWREAYDTFSNAEQECIRTELGADKLGEFLDARAGEFWYAVTPLHATVFGCLEPETADELYMTLFRVGLGGDGEVALFAGGGVAVAVGQVFLSCLERILPDVDIAKVLAADLPGATAETKAIGEEFIDRLQVCLYELDPPDGKGPPLQRSDRLWHFDTGQTSTVVLSPIIVQGRLYASSSSVGEVYALNAQTGEILWSFELDTDANNLWAPPVAAGSTVYIEHPSGDYYALDAATGEHLLLNIEETGRIRGVELRDGAVHVTAVFPDGGIVVRSYDPQTGQLLRESWPQVPEIDYRWFKVTVLGDSTYIRDIDPGRDGGMIYAFDGTEGNLRWSFEAASTIYSAPAASDGRVYLRSHSGIHALDETTGDEIWSFGGAYGGDENPLHTEDGVLAVAEVRGALHGLDTATGQALWSSRYGYAHQVTAAADGTLFVIGSDGFHALDAATGDEIWSISRSWNIFGEVTVTDGVLYSNSGYGLHALNARTGEPIWTTNNCCYRPQGGSYILQDGVLYLADRGIIRAYRAPATTDTSPPAETPTPVPTAPPTPTPTPEPTPTPTPEPAPTPTPEPAPRNPGPLKLDENSLWREAYDTFSNAEQECIRTELGTDKLEEFLDAWAREFWSRVTPRDATIFGCLATDTADELYIALIRASPGGDQVFLSCFEELIPDVDIAKVLAAPFPGATAEMILAEYEFADRFWACLHDLNLQPGTGPRLQRNDDLLWFFDTGQASTLAFSPTIVQGRLYAAAVGEVYALNAQTGELLWSVKLDAELQPPPVAAGSTVYIERERGDYYSLDAATGEHLLLNIEETGRIRGVELLDGAVHVTAVFPDGGIVVRSYDPHTGQLLRESRPQVPKIDYLRFNVTVLGDITYIRDGTMTHAFDAPAGNLLWSFDTGVITRGAPAASDGVAYMRSATAAHALDETTGDEIWKFDGPYGDWTEHPTYIVDGVWPVVLRYGALHGLDAATGQPLWSHRDGYATFVAGAADGTVFAVGEDGFHALDAATGDEIWSLGIAWEMQKVTVADGVLYSNSQGGWLHALDARTGEPIWTTDGVSYRPQGADPYHVAPYGVLVRDGVLYLAHERIIFALAAPQRK